MKPRLNFKDFLKGLALRAYVFLKLQTGKDMVRQMSKKSRLRRLLNKIHGKPSQRLLKSEGQHLCHLYWSMWKQLSWKKTLLVICQILGVFLNALNENDKYSVLNQDNLTQPIQIQLSRKEKKFSKFFPKFSKTRLNLEHFQRNRWHSSSTSEMKLPKTIEIWMQHLYYLYWSSWRLLSWKKSLLVICKILGLFVNTLTADEKYSLLNRDNLMQPIQMQLS